MMHKLAHVHVSAIRANAHNAHTLLRVCICAAPSADLVHVALAYADSPTRPGAQL